MVISLILNKFIYLFICNQIFVYSTINTLLAMPLDTLKFAMLRHNIVFNIDDELCTTLKTIKTDIINLSNKNLCSKTRQEIYNLSLM